MTRVICGLLCGSLFLAAPIIAFAQPFTGGLRGSIRDANGVVPRVAVTLTNEATGNVRTAVSNDVGEYTFTAVTPGTYRVTTRLQGYKSLERPVIRVGTQQFITLDLMLDVGPVAESVTVTVGQPVLETSNASQGATLDRETLASLPAPGRNAFLMATVVPTFNSVGDPQFNRQQDQTNASRLSLGGGGIRANNYLVDGVPITDLSGRAVFFPTIEALEEIHVQTRTYDAETGRTGGGVFNVTARSGSNQYRGSGFFQTRPVWGQSLNFFSDVGGQTKKETGLADTYYRLWGGGLGGPIARNRTFFWTSVEGYRSETTRNLQRLWPSVRQREGDFSRSTLGGQPVRLFNPWCRGGAVNARCPATGTGSLATGGEFLNATIPRTHPAANPVGFNILGQWPSKTNLGQPIRENEDNNPNAITTANIVDEADMWTMKAEHKFSDRWSLSGFYVYNNTDEPGASAMPESNLFMDLDYFIFRRRPHALVVNDQHILSDRTVLSLRYGWTRFQDQLGKVPFESGLSGLGFAPAYVNAVSADARDRFPWVLFDEVSAAGGVATDRTWSSPYSINAAVSTLRGKHSLKAGADFRRLSVKSTTELQRAGLFFFNRQFTSSSTAPGSGQELASLLLGLPSGGFVPINGGEGEWFTRYSGAYLQDDWRATPRLTVNYGVRFEHEDGLREIANRQTVAFDRNVTSPLDGVVPKAGTSLAGRTIRGGLMYAGVDGAPEHQGNPPALNVSPRIGAAWALRPETVVRGGYGLFFAPWQYTSDLHSQIGFSRTTFMGQSAADRDVPITTFDNPFPSGLLQPVGSSLGLLTGVGGNIDFIDQDKGSPRVHQYSLDLQHQLRGGMAVTLGYIGATGRDLGFGGTNNVAININQIDPNVARQLYPAPGGGWDVAKLREEVPNPFFGVSQAGSLAGSPTISRGQLLRPYPQFGDVLMRESTKGGRRQYHAVTLGLDKRISSNGWGGRFSYTWSRTKDNQFGEVNLYGTGVTTPQNNYDLDAEYSLSSFDAPHRIIFAPIVRIPSRGQGVASRLLGGWMASAIVELMSGPPLNATLSGGTSEGNLALGGGLQRPDLNGDPNTPGGDSDRVATAIDQTARWFDAGAFANPGAGRYGTSPRTIGSARYQFRKNVDLAFSKDVRVAGSQAAQIRVEILNLTNTPKFGGAANAVDLSSFGRVTDQLGFSRIWQLSFRYSF